MLKKLAALVDSLKLITVFVLTAIGILGMLMVPFFVIVGGEQEKRVQDQTITFASPDNRHAVISISGHYEPYFLGASFYSELLLRNPSGSTTTIFDGDADPVWADNTHLTLVTHWARDGYLPTVNLHAYDGVTITYHLADDARDRNARPALEYRINQGWLKGDKALPAYANLRAWAKANTDNPDD